jgi:MFS family permease
MPFTYVPITTLGALVVIRFLHGTATAIFGPVASATLSDFAPPDRRGTWLGLYSTIQGTGQAFGPVLAGLLIAGGRYDRSFFTSGLIGLLALTLILRWPRTSVPRRRSVSSELRQGIAEVAGDARILTTSLAQAGQFFLNGTMNAFLPLYAREIVGLPAVQIGLVFGAQTATALLVRPLFGRLSDRIGRQPVITAGLFISAFALAGLSFASNLPSVLGAAVAYGTGLAVTTSATSALVTDLARRARYGAAHGIFGTIYDIGDALGPIAAGFIVAGLGYRRTFQLIAGIALALAGLFAYRSRAWSREAASGAFKEEIA